MTTVYDEVGRHSIYENVQLFIGSKTDIQKVAMFKYFFAYIWSNYTISKIPINLSNEKSDHF